MGQFAEGFEPQTSERPCKLGKLVEEFDDDDRETFSVLASRQPHPRVQAIIDRFGGAVKERTVSKHVHGRCSCPEGTFGKGMADG